MELSAGAFLGQFRKRYSFDDLASYLDGLKLLNVMVIGEAIIDQYDYVEPLGLSPKGGVIATRYLETEQFAGGSVACANHIAGFCSSVNLVTAVGSRDSYGDFIAESLRGNIMLTAMRRAHLTTIIKKREIDVSCYRKHSETYIFDDILLNRSEEDAFIELLRQNLIEDADLVFVIDYGHGLMTDKVIRFVADNAAFLSVNTQANSGNKGLNVITKYPRADFVCLDQMEARLAFGDNWSPVSDLAKKLQKSVQAPTVAITLGRSGSLILCGDKITEVPAISGSGKIVDTVGAGDAYYSLAAPCIRAGLPLEVCGFIGNAAGVLSTAYQGHKNSVNRPTLGSFIIDALK